MKLREKIFVMFLPWTFSLWNGFHVSRKSGEEARRVNLWPKEGKKKWTTRTLHLPSHRGRDWGVLRLCPRKLWLEKSLRAEPRLAREDPTVVPSYFGHRVENCRKVKSVESDRSGVRSRPSDSREEGELRLLLYSLPVPSAVSRVTKSSVRGLCPTRPKV